MLKILQYLILFIILTSCSARQAECVKEQIEIGNNRKCIMGVPLGGIYGDKPDFSKIRKKMKK